MQLTSLLRSAAEMAVLSVLSLLLLQTAQAQTGTDLYNFCSVNSSVAACTDGENPIGPLAADGYGNFYGVGSEGGGSSFGGVVFGLTPEPSGGCEGTNPGNGWCEFVLYNFCSVANCADGDEPLGSVSDLNGHFRTPGDLYGTTYYGGSHNVGVVFEISSRQPLNNCPAGSNTSGSWCETVLYNFCSIGACADGFDPFGNLVEDSTGNLYGTVVNGVFQLSPNRQGGWNSVLIYTDYYVQGGLAIDGAENLYGIDANYSTGVGNVFKISLSQAGYPQVNIHTFEAVSGGLPEGFPAGSIAVDSAGNVFGTTNSGGAKNLGTVWKLTPLTTGKKAGTYTKKILHTFTAEKTGEYPLGGVLLDSSGNIYSTTTFGGSPDCQGCGTVFELVPNGNTYKYKLLWSFNGTDGASPASAPSLNSSGSLYGVAGGGANSEGTIYEVTP